MTIAPAVVASLLLVVAMVRDFRTEGRVHPVYIYGTLVLLAVKFLNWPVSETAAWQCLCWRGFEVGAVTHDCRPGARVARTEIHNHREWL